MARRPPAVHTFTGFDLSVVHNAVEVPIPRARGITVTALDDPASGWDTVGATLSVLWKSTASGEPREIAAAAIAAGGGAYELEPDQIPAGAGILVVRLDAANASQRFTTVEIIVEEEEVEVVSRSSSPAVAPPPPAQECACPHSS